MARRFQFDDEEDIQEYPQDSQMNTLEEKQEEVPFVATPKEETPFVAQDTYEEENQEMAKKKKKFTWKWWHYVLITFTVLAVAFMVYIFALSSHDGPVYGNRGESVIAIPKDLQTAAADTIKNKYAEIETITMETTPVQLKVDIQFTSKMDTKKAQKIAEEAVQTLDELVGTQKDEGKTYSQLFGKINNVPQYEVNLLLMSNDSKDFPIYGTKHIQNDKFSYTLSSIKDKDSYDKAQETLKNKTGYARFF